MKAISLLLVLYILSYNQLKALAVDSILQLFNKKISQREFFEKDKLSRIKKIYINISEAKENGDLESQFRLSRSLFEEYKSYYYDSAFYYAIKANQLAYQSNDNSKISLTKTDIGFTLLSAGMFNEALDTLNTINAKGLKDSLKIYYYYIKARTYADLSTYSGDDFYSPVYRETSLKLLDSAISLCTDLSFYNLKFKGLKYLILEDYKKAKPYYEQLITQIAKGNQEYAMATACLGIIYLKEGNIEKAILMYVESSSADFQSAIKETVSSLRLAELLYEYGFTKEAYQYIKIAQEDADFYKAKFRHKQVSTIFPAIEGNKLNIVESQRKQLIRLTLIISFLALLFGGSVIIIMVQLRRLRLKDENIQKVNHYLKDINKKLTDANKIKEGYIGFYFNVSSTYISKIESLKKEITRKLATKRIDDIDQIINHINLKKERESLYVSFDKAFLKIFPDFVEKYNLLFKPGDRVIQEEEKLLNTDLRIFALIRMGITDNEDIAKILGYSVQTIYNYKTRIKNKSVVANDLFEQKIMEIEAV